MKFEKTALIPANRDNVFSHCASRHGFEQLFPYKTRWINGKANNWDLRDRLFFKYRYLGIWFNHEVEIIECVKNESFTDEMKKPGIFKRFCHTHTFKDLRNGSTEIMDKVDFTLGLGEWIDKRIGIPILNATFAKRHAALKSHFEMKKGAADGQGTIQSS